ncbi:MAG TPA: lipoprotein insertase outer membrane protein LolB [Patescibacteria group bacterium]|nr:lipoprotein insertase outer membrane protein LolB [Patescibacteria group bacterium]
MNRALARAVVLVAMIVLAACAGRRGEIAAVDDAGHWRLEGRLAVSDGRDSGTGAVTWEQDGAYFMIGLRAPVTGQSWRLSGDDRLCTLEGLKSYPLTADSPEALLERELGWHLPVAPLRDWLQGRPMHADTPATRNADGRISGFSEAGWTISYRDFRDGRPTRITARKPPYQVRLAIKSWIVLP